VSTLRSLYSFIRLGRPLFLLGGFVFHALGVSAALYQGFSINWAALIWGQVAITATQLMTHYSNDYFDLPADRANISVTRWSGGSRVLPAGLLPAWVALAGALAFAAIAISAVLVLGLFIQPSLWTFILPLLALLLAWEYSAPPLRLHSSGFGELTVALIVPVLTPLVGYTAQVSSPAGLILLAAFPLACFQVCMVISVNLPDAAGDRKVDKRTLVIRFGPGGAACLYLICLALAYGTLPILVQLGLPLLVAQAVILPLPVALWQAYRIGRGAWTDPSAWNSLAFWSIALMILSAVLEALAFFWLVLA
jgi:1,4-dihydroxy-2-naphthoate octaprenyltransferase